MKLNGKVAIITGGSRGIGFATAKRFLEEGAAVVITASSEASAAKGAEKLRDLFPEGRIGGIAPDLSSLSSLQEAFNKVKEEYGKIDILVNNAGASDSTPFLSYTEELFDKLMNLNVKGVFNASRAVADIMVEQGSGVILSTSSMVSISGQP